MTSYLTSMNTISLSLTVLEIYRNQSFQGLTLNFDPQRSSGVNFFYTIWKPIYEFLFDFYGQHLSISYRFRDISLQSFQSLTLTFDPKTSSEVKIFHTIRKPIYDFLFDFYEHHLSISHRSRDIRNQSFQGLTLTFDPQRSSGVENFYTIRKPIYDFLFDFYGQHLSISYRFRDIPLQSFQGLTLTFDHKRLSEVKIFYTIRKPIYYFLFDFYEHHLSISHRS